MGCLVAFGGGLFGGFGGVLGVGFDAERFEGGGDLGLRGGFGVPGFGAVGGGLVSELLDVCLIVGLGLLRFCGARAGFLGGSCRGGLCGRWCGCCGFRGGLCGCCCHGALQVALEIG